MQQEVLPFCPASVSFYNAKAKVDRKVEFPLLSQGAVSDASGSKPRLFQALLLSYRVFSWAPLLESGLNSTGLI